jgi:hypothetical protein
MQLVPRLRQPIQTESDDVAKVHRILRRLHSQQLRVPLRIFRRLASTAIPCPDTGESRASSELASMSSSAARDMHLPGATVVTTRPVLSSTDSNVVLVLFGLTLRRVIKDGFPIQAKMFQRSNLELSILSGKGIPLVVRKFNHLHLSPNDGDRARAWSSGMHSKASPRDHARCKHSGFGLG